MLIAARSIQQVKSSVDIVSVVSKYVQLERRGNRYWGLSPFKQEKTASFCVFTEQNAYYCFSTQQGGDVFSFIQELERCSFVEAVELLAKSANIELERVGTTSSGLSQKQEDQRKKHHEQLLELNRRLSDSFEHLLHNSDEGRRAKSYLEQRGITQHTMRDFRIGYCPRQRGWLYQFLKQRYYSDSFLHTTGLFHGQGGNTNFAGRIMFPITNWKEQVIAFGGRTLADDVPKYLNSPEYQLYKKKHELYAHFGALKKRGRGKSNSELYLVEGYLDVLALYQLGIAEVMATLGTALTEYQSRLLRRFGNSVNIVYDSDEAGVKAAIRSANILEQNCVSARIVSLPSNIDPADLLHSDDDTVRGHPQKFLADTAVSPVQFIVQQTATTDDRNYTRTLSLVFNFVHALRSEVAREQSLHECASLLNLSNDAVIKDYNNTPQYHSYHNHDNGTERDVQLEHDDADGDARTNSVESTRTDKESPELLCLIHSAIFPECFPYVRSQIRPTYLRNQAALRLFTVQEQLFHEQRNTFDDIVKTLESPQNSDILSNILLHKRRIFNTIKPEVPSEYGKRLIHSAVRHLQRGFIVRNRHLLIKELRSIERLDTPSVSSDYHIGLMNKIQSEIKFLNDELHKYS